MAKKDNFDIRRESLKLLSLIYDVNKEPAIKKMAAELISDVISGKNDMQIERHYHLDIFSKEGSVLRTANYPSRENANEVAKVALGYGWLVKGKII